MAYSEELADRVRAALGERGDLDERKMFGGLAFMHNGHMFSGVLGEQLVVRLGPEAAERALEQPHTAPMDFTGRPLKGYVYVAPAGLRNGEEIRRWLQQAIEFVESLPAK
jgi:TfoX/Sxy family transcriptional regulator of competence genes